ncbi:MAG: hypothetical protein V4463_22950 [Pseudomonadota bacterium]
MKKTVWIWIALGLAAAGCNKHEPVAPPPPPAPKVDNVGDTIAKDIHGKLDKATDAGKAVEQAGADQAEKIKAATEEAPKK